MCRVSHACTFLSQCSVRKIWCPYIVCNDKKRKLCGRFQSGREYLESNPHIPTSFTKPGMLGMLKFDHYNYDNGTTLCSLCQVSHPYLLSHLVLVQQQLSAKYCELSNPVSGRSNYMCVVYIIMYCDIRVVHVQVCLSAF